VAGGSTCGSTSTFDTLVSVPAVGSTPAVDVRCKPSTDSGTVVGGSGAVTDTHPANGVLALGTRNGEPGPHNYSVEANVYDSTYAERGVDFQRSSTGGNSTTTFTGNVVSNSPIRRGATAGALAATGTVTARGACENVTPCTAEPYTTGATADPMYPYRTPTMTLQSVPTCPTNTTTVPFSPGFYNSATALNTLFSTCKDKDFWFQPGTYYFDFRDTGGSTQCRPHTGVAADTLHEWCIGPFSDSKTKVVGGTRAGWTGATITSQTVTSNSFWAGESYPHSWTNKSNATSINGSYAYYTWSGSSTESYMGAMLPVSTVPTDATAITDVEFDVATSIGNSGTANRTAIVMYGESGDLDNLQICPNLVPITQSTQTITGFETCLDTPAKVNSAVVAVLYDATSWNGQFRFDGVRMRATYTPAGSGSGTRASFPGGCDPAASGVQFIFGGDSRMYVSDGSVELCAGPNPGGSTTNQQIALYGVRPLTPVRPTNGPEALKSIGEQGGIVAQDVTIQPQCGSGAGQLSCSWFGGSGTVYESVSVDFPAGQFSLPANTVLQRLDLRASYKTWGSGNLAPEFVVKNLAGQSAWSCTADSGLPASTADRFSAFTRSVSTSCLTASRIAAGFTVEWRARASGSCGWFGFGCNGPFTQQLDGLELIVSIDPTSSTTAVVMPQDGCITPTPNTYSGTPLTNRYGTNVWDNKSAPDCALISWDAVPRTSGTTSQIGCYSGQVSLQGTLYAPGAAVVFDQAGPRSAACAAASPTYTSWSYPIFARGAIVRTLRVAGMRDPTPHAIATCGSATCGGALQDRVVTLQARINGTTEVEARVRYPASGGAADVEFYEVL
jgi:hypothetical protein